MMHKRKLLKSFNTAADENDEDYEPGDDTLGRSYVRSGQTVTLIKMEKKKHFGSGMGCYIECVDENKKVRKVWVGVTYIFNIKNNGTIYK